MLAVQIGLTEPPVEAGDGKCGLLETSLLRDSNLNQKLSQIRNSSGT
jgi:hypothetical protein